MLEQLTLQIGAGNNLEEGEAEAALQEILSERSRDAEISKFLIALAQKGESESEITGFARAMRRLAVRIQCRHEVFVDTAGTGGGRSTFNISTVAALVAAGARIRVAKHGNRAITSRSGSADVLLELGVKIDCPPAVSERALDEIGICFLFAPLFHPAMKRVAEIRRNLGRKSIFNMLGPLTNPANAPFQVVGVSAPELAPRLGESLRRLGCRRAWVVHGLDGLDEVSVSAETEVVEVRGEEVRSFRFRPLMLRLGVPEGGTPRENAQLIRGILGGAIAGPAREIVLLNAAVAIHVASDEPFSSALRLAEESLLSGAAQRKLHELVEFYD